VLHGFGLAEKRPLCLLDRHALQREAANYVRYWHLADIDADDEHVCFWG
jgi:hypothetical protein